MNHSQNTFETGLGQVRLGVSACLLGAKVRFDGGHKRNRFVIEELGSHFEFVSFCPEVAIGMGTPRPSIRLVGDVEAPRALGSRDDGLDVTDALQAYSANRAQRLEGLSGFIFKKDSPSCGSGARSRAPVTIWCRTIRWPGSGRRRRSLDSKRRTWRGSSSPRPTM